MNRLSTMNASPQIHRVTSSAESIDVQLDAIGVCHHGLMRWNRTEPTTNAAMAIAKGIGPHLPIRRQSCAFSIQAPTQAEGMSNGRASRRERGGQDLKIRGGRGSIK